MHQILYTCLERRNYITPTILCITHFSQSICDEAYNAISTSWYGKTGSQRLTFLAISNVDTVGSSRAFPLLAWKNFEPAPSRRGCEVHFWPQKPDCEPYNDLFGGSIELLAFIVSIYASISCSDPCLCTVCFEYEEFTKPRSTFILL